MSDKKTEKTEKVGKNEKVLGTAAAGDPNNPEAGASMWQQDEHVIREDEPGGSLGDAEREQEEQK